MRLRSIVATSLVALFGVGCSLLLDTPDATQCKTTQDCAANPALSGRECIDGLCVPPRVLGDSGPSLLDSKEGCKSTALCTQDNSNQFSVCPGEGQDCIPWQTPQCFALTPEAKIPGAIIVGTIFPFTTTQYDGKKPESVYADRIRRAVDLAAAEFKEKLPTGLTFPNGTARPIGVVHCDSGFTVQGAQSAFEHLTTKIGVSAVIVGSDDDMNAIAPGAAGTPLVCEGCVGRFPAGTSAWRIVPRLDLNHRAQLSITLDS